MFKNLFFGNWLKSSVSLVLIFIIIWLLASLYLLSQSTTIIFQNQVSWAPVPNFGYSLNFEKGTDGLHRSFIFFEKPSSNQVILYLHGNTGRINDFFPELTKNANVLSPAYPGYHESEGSPTQENVYETAVMSYDWLLKKGFKEENIIIFGHSLGGSVAVYLASQKPKAKKLVIANTFSSIQSMCVKQYLILCSFTGDVFNSSKYAKEITIPVVQLAYKNDLKIPFEEGKKLHTNFVKSSDKKFIEMDKYSHTYLDFDLILKNI
jgi:uncharacterized protein